MLNVMYCICVGSMFGAGILFLDWLSDYVKPIREFADWIIDRITFFDPDDDDDKDDDDPWENDW